MRGRSLVRLNPLRLSTLHLSLLSKAVVLCLFLLPLSAIPLCAAASSNHDWDYEETHSDAREFVAGGMLHVKLSVGDLHIRRGDSSKISLRYTAKSRRERNVKDSHVDFDVRGNDAVIDFHAPMGGNTAFDVELEVPANTNLDVHSKVGDVTVENVEGDKDLQLGVGDIRVESGQAGYRLVNASTGIGEVNGDGYGETSGWLGKTLKYHGEGKYELRHTSAWETSIWKESKWVEAFQLFNPAGPRWSAASSEFIGGCCPVLGPRLRAPTLNCLTTRRTTL